MRDNALVRARELDHEIAGTSTGRATESRPAREPRQERAGLHPILFRRVAEEGSVAFITRANRNSAKMRAKARPGDVNRTGSTSRRPGKNNAEA